MLGYKASVEMVEMIIEDKIRRERNLGALKKEEEWKGGFKQKI